MYSSTHVLCIFFALLYFVLMYFVLMYLCTLYFFLHFCTFALLYFVLMYFVFFFFALLYFVLMYFCTLYSCTLYFFALLYFILCCMSSILTEYSTLVFFTNMNEWARFIQWPPLEGVYISIKTHYFSTFFTNYYNKCCKIWYFVMTSKHQPPTINHQVPSTKYQVPTTKYQPPSTRHNRDFTLKWAPKDPLIDLIMPSKERVKGSKVKV
jgi:hypothetical protein